MNENVKKKWVEALRLTLEEAMQKMCDLGYAFQVRLMNGKRVWHVFDPADEEERWDEPTWWEAASDVLGMPVVERDPCQALRDDLATFFAKQEHDVAMMVEQRSKDILEAAELDGWDPCQELRDEVDRLKARAHEIAVAGLASSPKAVVVQAMARDLERLAGIEERR